MSGPLYQAGFKPFVPAAIPANFQIVGPDSQVLEVLLPPQGILLTEPGNMLHMHRDFVGDVVLGGCGQACKRYYCAGENFIRVSYQNQGQSDAVIGVTPAFPSKIIPIDLGQNDGLHVKAGAFMCAVAEKIDLELVCADNCCAGCFGGQGLIISVLHGQGLCFLNASGTIIYKDLAEGEELIVDTHSVVAWGKTVKMDVRTVGNICMCCCGGEGIFNTVLIGPGPVWMQSLSYDKLVEGLTKDVQRKLMQRGGGGGGGAAAGV